MSVSLRFSTWMALGDVDLRFLLFLVTKANDIEWGTILAACLYHQSNQSTHGTDDVTVTSLSRSASDHLYQIALNRKLSRKSYKAV